MILIPAIDIRKGKCVRLTQGDENQETVYSNDPIQMAQKWVGQGARRLHVVDLDGAFDGEPRNHDTAIKIKQETGVFVELGGGFRNIEAMAYVLDRGIDRIVLGTIIIENPDLTQEAFKRFSDKIIVGLDARNGYVAIKGWKDTSPHAVSDILSKIEGLGGAEIIFTDISRDGALQGVNIDGIKDVMSHTSLSVIASGGVTSLRDIEALKNVGAPACIIGKALYDGRINLVQAQQVVNQ